MNNFKGHFEINKAFFEIDEKFHLFNEFYPREPREFLLPSIFSQYMVVFISRTLEGSIKNLIFTKIQIMNISPEKKLDIEEKIKDFGNPNFEKIKLIFKQTLNVDIKHSLFTQEELRSLSILIGDRHAIAHSNETIEAIQNIKSLSELEMHYKNIKYFIEKLCCFIYDE